VALPTEVITTNREAGVKAPAFFTPVKKILNTVNPLNWLESSQNWSFQIHQHMPRIQQVSPFRYFLVTHEGDIALGLGRIVDVRRLTVFTFMDEKSTAKQGQSFGFCFFTTARSLF
jgi:hypothetical protein